MEHFVLLVISDVKQQHFKKIIPTVKRGGGGSVPGWSCFAS